MCTFCSNWTHFEWTQTRIEWPPKTLHYGSGSQRPYCFILLMCLAYWMWWVLFVHLLIHLVDVEQYFLLVIVLYLTSPPPPMDYILSIFKIMDSLASIL